MPLLDFVNFYLVPGIVLGAIYSLGAIGITLVFGVLRFAHLAHGDLATIGAFLALALVMALGLNPWAALPVAMAATAAVAVALHWLFYEHLRRRGAILTVIASLGVALMLRAVVQVVWGVDSQSYAGGIQILTAAQDPRIDAIAPIITDVPLTSVVRLPALIPWRRSQTVAS